MTIGDLFGSVMITDEYQNNIDDASRHALPAPMNQLSPEHSL